MAAVSLVCRVWVNTENYEPVKWALTEEIEKVIRESKI